MKNNISKIIIAASLAICLTACANNSDKMATAENTETTALSSEETVGDYIDGVYTGTGVGYAGGLKMQVTVENGFITKVECLSHNEVGKQYYEAAFENVPGIIIEKQGTEDVVAVVS